MNDIDPMFLTSDNDENLELAEFERWLTETGRNAQIIVQASVIVHSYAARCGFRRLSE